MVGPGMYERKIDHGITILATGAVEYKPKEYLYGQDDGVMTQIELDGGCMRRAPKPEPGDHDSVRGLQE
jgi:hypothetical protein